MVVVGRRREKADIRACLSKTRWKSQEAAQRALAAKRQEHPGVFDSLVRPYRCRATGGSAHWHWGHDG